MKKNMAWLASALKNYPDQLKKLPRMILTITPNDTTITRRRRAEGYIVAHSFRFNVHLPSVHRSWSGGLACSILSRLRLVMLQSGEK